MWEIERESDGVFVIRKDRRLMHYEDDLDEARLYLRRKGVPEVTIIEADGYRTTTRP
jgi:hypothetical protein